MNHSLINQNCTAYYCTPASFSNLAASFCSLAWHFLMCFLKYLMYGSKLGS